MSDLVGNPEDRFSHEVVQLRPTGWLHMQLFKKRVKETKSHQSVQILKLPPFLFFFVYIYIKSLGKKNLKLKLP